jgi:hypothetical protein
MQSRRKFIGQSAGALALAGAIGHKPLSVAAKQDGTPEPESQDDDTGAAPILGTPTLQPAIDIVRAQEIALEGQSGAVVRWVKLDGDDGVLHYDVVLDNGVEVEVDATTGQIAETEQGGDDEEDDDNGDEEDDEDQGEEDDENGDDNGNGDDDEEEEDEEGEGDDEDESGEDADEPGDVDENGADPENGGDDDDDDEATKSAKAVG